MKKAVTLGLTIGLFITGTITSLAGEWRNNNIGWWYVNDDGTCPNNVWQWIDGNHDGIAECYFFNIDGYLLTNTITPDGYFVNENGAWSLNGDIQWKSVQSTISNDVVYRALYANKKDELRASLPDEEEYTYEFYERDLNSDGIDELIALKHWYGHTHGIRVWTFQNGRINELKLADMPNSNTELRGKTLVNSDVGHSSGGSSLFYQLIGEKVQFVEGIAWESGAWHDSDHDLYYVIDENQEKIREISEAEYLAISGKYNS